GRLQNAALDTLKHNRNPQVAALLLASWNRLSPSLRQAGIALLLSRDAWTKELLGGLENGVVGRNEVSLADRQRLLKVPDKELHQGAKRFGQRARRVAGRRLWPNTRGP